MAETLSRHAEVTRDTFAVCEKTRQVAEAAAKAAKELDDAIRHGWREVNTEKLAVRIQGELETALLRPLVAQCRQVEEMTPALRDAADQLKESASNLCAFHFKGILAVMLAACLIVMGGSFAYGWWNLSRHYDRMVDAALKRILSVNTGNQEAFTRLTEMNVPIRVLPVTDSKKQTIPRKFALVMDHAEDVAVEDTPDGKRVAIYFEKAAY
jgi:hypothetical protein